MKKTRLVLSLWLMAILIFSGVSSCEEEDPIDENEDTPIASFQVDPSDTNPFEITFTNFSQNATSYTWDFGDTEISTEESPVHTFAAYGVYTVVLTASNDVGESSTFSVEVTISDPDELLTILAGTESKKWILLREGIALGIGSSATTTEHWSYGGVTPLGDRPCILDDEYTFFRDGSFQNDTKGTFFLDAEANFGWNDELGADLCHEDTDAGIYTSSTGVDLSALANGGDYSYEFDATATPNMIQLNGVGVYVGLANRHNAGGIGNASSPVEAMTYEVTTLADGDGVDSLTLSMPLEDGNYWNFYLVHYENEADTPEIPEAEEPEDCEPEASISPSEISHTFASAEASEWVLLQPSESGSGLELGVDDPTDAGATKVGKYIRNADVDYQELQFKLDPANAINFENLTTITMDVYLPSSNDYSGDLTDNVFIGFGATKCPPNWWEDQHEYQQVEIAQDSWVTITFDLTAPDFVGNPANGETVKDRNDLDMVYIGIGGGGHGVGAEFYIRNFVIN